jgi:NAD(P)-dependent dehydrogenase (short-subunit alcohol dehydrogenase family)
MGRVVFVSDVQTLLGEELVRRYLAEGASVAATRSNQEARESPLVSENDGFLLTDWNRRSVISSRNVLLTVLNRYGRIDEAVIMQAPAVERSLLHETAYELIERAVDAWIKGTLFMIKGVLEAFGRGGGGLLALVHHVPQEAGTDFPPLEAALRGAFKSAAQSLFATNSQAGVRINGFESFSSQAREFAEFIVQTMQERGGRTSGKWFRYQPRGGFLAPLKKRL